MTRRSAAQLREDALAIWQAGVDAVGGQCLVQQSVVVDGDQLWIDDLLLPLSEIRRMVVVGAGKASAGMAEGLEAAFGSQLMADKQLVGWVNVPDDCVKALSRIHLHAARPAGKNEPAEAGVMGTRKILELVDGLGPHDLCLCLISGGGSALLPAPVEGITLDDKQQLARFLSRQGANIHEINRVRTLLSEIKGGGLARRCRAGRLVTLLISDVLGDPLDVIASGPTVSTTAEPGQALEILQRFDPHRRHLPESIYRVLSQSSTAARRSAPATIQVEHRVLGNNAVAVDAAGMEAERRGYSHAMETSRDLHEDAELAGQRLAALGLRMNEQAGPDCLISGGEPVVKLADTQGAGQGGRNQHLVLAALNHLLGDRQGADNRLTGICLLSGGTDGEDGPTDAAGAVIDESTVTKMVTEKLSPEDYLTRYDSYHFFSAIGDLIRTGPTHTNVCDLRVCLTARIESARHETGSSSS